jgi:hypothetical protein
MLNSGMRTLAKRAEETKVDSEQLERDYAAWIRTPDIKAWPAVRAPHTRAGTPLGCLTHCMRRTERAGRDDHPGAYRQWVAHRARIVRGRLPLPAHARLAQRQPSLLQEVSLQPGSAPPALCACSVGCVAWALRVRLADLWSRVSCLVACACVCACVRVCVCAVVRVRVRARVVNV